MELRGINHLSKARDRNERNDGDKFRTKGNEIEEKEEKEERPFDKHGHPAGLQDTGSSFDYLQPTIIPLRLHP